MLTAKRSNRAAPMRSLKLSVDAPEYMITKPHIDPDDNAHDTVPSQSESVVPNSRQGAYGSLGRARTTGCVLYREILCPAWSTGQTH